MTLRSNPPNACFADKVLLERGHALVCRYHLWLPRQRCAVPTGTAGWESLNHLLSGPLQNQLADALQKQEHLAAMDVQSPTFRSSVHAHLGGGRAGGL